MPSETMGSPSLYTDKVSIHDEKQDGFWKTNAVHKFNGPLSPFAHKKQISVNSQSGRGFAPSDSYLNRDQRAYTLSERFTSPSEKGAGVSVPRGFENIIGSASYNSNGDKLNFTGAPYESGLFSSSLSELFSRKMRLSSTTTPFGHSVGATEPHEEEEPFESLKELEAQTIGDLLPDDDEDLFSGVADGINHNARFINGDEIEEDLFGSVGGIELGEVGDRNSESFSGNSNGLEHPSRTLFVRNIDINIEDSELRYLFQQYGEIHTLYTACKHRGFVMVSYYDIRAACIAMKNLQKKLLRNRSLDVHFSIPKDTPTGKDVNQGTLTVFNLDSSVSNDELRQIFGVYGEIKKIYEVPYKNSHKFIEFYDVRAAEAALHALDMTLISGKRISLSGGLPMSPYLENQVLNGISASVPTSFPSLPSVGSTVNMSNSIEASNSLGQLKFDIRGTPSFHPHSLPDHHNGAIYNSPGQQHYMWSKTPQGIMWPNSPPFGNGTCSPRLQQIHAIGRGPSHLSTGSLPINNHHVGSAPSVNPSLFAAKLPDASVFNPGSLGSMRIHGGGSPNFMDFVPRMDLPSPNNLQMHPQNQRCIMVPGRGQVVSSFYDSPSERTRSRRNEGGSSSQGENRKQFELDIDRIMRGDDKRTTLMIKNIPNKYTSKMLLAAIDERHRGSYDFLYLPIDFKNKCNVGYAFINMMEPSLIVPFYQAFNGKKWEKFNSEKVASLAYGRIQGKVALIAHFQNSSLMNEDKRCRPILFHTDGPNAGDQVPFPVGLSIRPRTGKNRSNTSEENNTLPNSLAEEESSSEKASVFSKDSD